NLAFVAAAALGGLCPQLLEHYRLKIFPNACEKFFTNLIGESIRLRRLVHMERNDFMNQLLELQKQHSLTDQQLVSHAMTFLIDGLDTSAATIAHCLLLLARNPDCQQQLLEELMSIDSSELPTYEELNEMSYLNACFNESLRIYPPGLWAAKICTKEYTFEGCRQSTPLRMRPGDTVMIPIYGLHHDPEFYPEPSLFRPGRFLPENGGVKKYRNMGVFLGFGDGPRQCLGLRLALVQSKAAIAAIVKRFEVRANPRTKPGIRLDPSIFVAMHEGGVWLDFVPRYQ
ncbi:probable cytochrome P450 28c1, partial [Scaptodrosophila lebanonensis]|uniref:Probable cytochrome P450 28c1 n=1 Tax=Drosophila lebanonensis TaxID=7225 RepID=A0A6J2U3P8_DROLE